MKKLIIIVLVIILSSCKSNNFDTTKEIKLPKDFKSISRLLDSIHDEDQKYRKELNLLSKNHEWESDKIKEQWKKIRKSDLENLKIVKNILDKHGWISSSKIGQKANSTLFLVIQHSDQETQEKYLPMMRKAVENNKANPASLALLEDRVALGKGELQIYGSQIGTDQVTGEIYVLPLLDPVNVNNRRAKVGLGTIEDYVSYWKIEWDIEEYLKKLPKWKEELKKHKIL